jgi:hypothetical protein
MREIDLESKLAMPKNTFLLYGDLRTGKTTFAGSFPRPLFLSDVTENGYESLREENWNDEVTPLFEPGVRPVVWGIEKESDLADCVAKARPLVESKRILSITVDSLSFYTDLIFNFILMRQTKADTRAAYGELGTHLRNARILVHSLGVPVVWTALAKHPEEGDPVGRPMIPGQQADKFAAGVDFVFYTRIDQPVPTKPPAFHIRTRRYLGYVAGNRLGARAQLLPDPFQGTYATLLTCLGYDVDAIRASLPPIAGLPSVSDAAKAPAPTVKPPIATVATKPPAATKPATIKVTAPNNGKPASPGR